MKKILFALWACVFIAGPAWADFMGHDVGLELRYPEIDSLEYDAGIATVGPGIEFVGALYGSVLNVDVSSNTITFADIDGLLSLEFTSATFNGFRIYDSGAAIEDIIAVTISPVVTNLAGFDSSFVSFNADNVYINFAGLKFYPETVVALDVQFVPVPGAVLLGMLGLSAAGIKLRKFA